MVLESRGVAWSRGKFKTYIHNHNAYDQQNWSSGDTEWGTPTANFRRSFNHMFLWVHVTNQICYISTSARLMGFKSSKEVTYWKRHSPIKSKNSLKPCSRETTRQIETLYLHYHNVCVYKTLQKGNLPWGAPTNKVKWYFNHVAL